MTDARRDGDGATPAKRVEMVVITGHSGAGKSEAIAAFEDGGYFCVDNLPPRMIGALGELFRHEGSGVERAAVVSDVRGGEYFEDLLAVLDELEAGDLDLKVLFLDADEETLLHRYKETRRRHPLARSGRIVDGIREERSLLAPLRERADLVIDTSVFVPTISVARNGDKMVLTYTGVLYGSHYPNGGYTPIGDSSPFTVIPTLGQYFFRSQSR